MNRCVFHTDKEVYQGEKLEPFPVLCEKCHFAIEKERERLIDEWLNKLKFEEKFEVDE